MLVKCAQMYPLEVPMGTPIKMAGETITHARTLLLRLIDESGREGWGEASAAPLMTGETLGSIAASTEYLVSKLVGARVDAPPEVTTLQGRVLYGNASAKSCHETALMDLLAQREGVPLYRLLAGDVLPTGNGRLEMLHMLASGILDSEMEDALALRRDGYRQWKIKVGASDTANDVHRVQALCAALTGDVVSADANQSLTVEMASAIASAGAACGLAFLEQPYRVGMTEAMALAISTVRLWLASADTTSPVNAAQSA
jgi:L-Ala-D/L-Glu epimerase